MPPLPAGLRIVRHLSESTLNEINDLAEQPEPATVEEVNVEENQNSVLDRSKRDLSEATKEIISITLSVKGFQFEPHSN